MSKLVRWFRDYNTEITWWVIGWLTFSAIDAILRSQWVLAAIDVFLICFNFKLWKERE